MIARVAFLRGNVTTWRAVGRQEEEKKSVVIQSWRVRRERFVENEEGGNRCGAEMDVRDFSRHASSSAMHIIEQRDAYSLPRDSPDTI